MNTERKTTIIIGALFLITTLTFLIGDEFIRSIVFTSEYLKNSFPNKNKIAFGTVLQLVNNVGVVAIGIMFLPTLIRYNKKIAFAYMSSRVIESVLLFVSSICILSIIPLSEEYSKTVTDVSYYETLGVLIKSIYSSAFQMAMISLGIGSLLLCYLLYISKLIPRAISVLGFIGYTSLLIKMLLELLGVPLGNELLYIGALFELIMPLWLLAKGFDTTKSTVDLVNE